MKFNYQGNLLACLKHAFSTHEPDRLTKLITEYCSIRPQTIDGWLNGKGKPLGATVITLRVMLECMDIDVDDYIAIPKLNRNLQKLVAIDVVSIEDIKDLLGYGTTNGPLDFMIRDRGMMSDKLELVGLLVEENNELLESGIGLLRDRLSAIKLDLAPPEEEQTSAAMPDEAEPVKAEPEVPQEDSLTDDISVSDKENLSASDFSLYSVVDANVQAITILVAELTLRQADSDVQGLLKAKYGSDRLFELADFFRRSARFTLEDKK